MLTQILIILSPLIISNQVDFKQCNSAERKSYKCSKEPLSNDLCLSGGEYEEVIDGEIITMSPILLSNCTKSDQKCQQFLLTSGKLAGVCVNKEDNGFEGDKCYSNGDCFSKKCEKKKCVAIKDGDSCSKLEYGCSKSSSCQAVTIGNDVCTKIVAPGDDCVNDDSCPLDYACGITKDTAGKTKCVKMFSLDTGESSTNALLCKSGFVYDENKYLPQDILFSNTKPHWCAESVSTGKQDKCSEYNDCMYTISYGAQTASIQGECKCSSNGVDSNCEIDTDNAIWKQWIETYTTEIKKIKAEDIKYIPYARKNHWNYKIKEAFEKKFNYAFLKNADECTIKFYTKGNFEALTFIILFLYILLF